LGKELTVFFMIGGKMAREGVGSGINVDELSENYEPPAPSPVASRGRSERRTLEHTVANFPSSDMTNPSQFRMVARNMMHAHSLSTPDEREFGRTWYPKVHDAVTKGVRRTGLSHLAGSAMVAAVSPNMDWERTNIPAFSELHHLSEDDWQHIHRSASQPRVFDPEEQKTKAAPRTAQAQDVLRGMSLSSIPDSNLVKAHRLLLGEDPEAVLPRQTAPKTNSFMHDIHDPSGESHPGGPHITIDARQHDMGINRMYPWTFSGRGISSADLPSSKRLLKSGEPGKLFGKKTRYEHFEEAARSASRQVGEENPIAFQATTWTTGKRLERSVPTASGADRQRGPERVGQRYFPGRPAVRAGASARRR
jgi:hypothetical protein